MWPKVLGAKASQASRRKPKPASRLRYFRRWRNWQIVCPDLSHLGKWTWPGCGSKQGEYRLDHVQYWELILPIFLGRFWGPGDLKTTPVRMWTSPEVQDSKAEALPRSEPFSRYQEVQVRGNLSWSKQVCTIFKEDLLERMANSLHQFAIQL